eukprot:14362031-Alexandrium_andersonii.AAC.1
MQWRGCATCSADGISHPWSLRSDPVTLLGGRSEPIFEFLALPRRGRAQTIASNCRKLHSTVSCSSLQPPGLLR